MDVYLEDDDGSIWGDDSLEIHLITGAGARHHQFQFICNSRNARFDARNSEIGWNSSWRAANAVASYPEWGGKPHAGKRAWISEITIPLADLGVQESDLNKDIWRVNLVRNAQPTGDVFGNTFDAYSEKSLFAYLRPQPAHAPVAQVLAIEVKDGTLRMSGRLVNPSEYTATIDVNVDLTSPPLELTDATKDLAKDEQSFSLRQDIQRAISAPPRGSAEFTIEEALSSERFNTIKIALQPEGDKDAMVLYRNSFQIENRRSLYFVAENYPGSERLDIELKIDAERITANLEVTLVAHDIEGAEFFRRRVPIHQPLQVESISYADWDEGDYMIEATFTTAPGNVVARQCETVAVMRPDWLNHKVPEIVLPPWRPMRYDDNHTVNVSERTLAWHDSLFPASIISRGREILDGPVRMFLSMDGETYELEPENTTVTRQDATRLEMRMTGSVGTGLVFACDLWMEYDGLVWYNFEFTAQKTVQVDRLSLEIPLREYAAHYSSRGKVSESIPQGKTGYVFTPFFLMHNHSRGFCFAAESTQNWNIDYGKHALETIRTADCTLFKTHFIGRKTIWNGKKSYAFGFQPLPVKPLPPDWHSWKIAGLRGTGKPMVWYEGELDAGLISPFTCGIKSMEKQYCLTTTGVNLTNPWVVNDKLSTWTDRCHKYGNTLAVPFFLLGYIDDAPTFDAAENRQLRTFRDEWLRMPFNVGPWSSHGTPMVCLNSSYKEYMLYGLKQVIKRYDVDGIYLDGCGAGGACSNRHHGCGYQTEEGVMPTYNILAQRDFLKKLATVLHLDTVNEPRISACAEARQPWPNYILWGHASSAVCPPVHAFLTLHFTGEQYQTVNTSETTYADLLTLDAFQAEFIPSATGILTHFLPFSGCDGTLDTCRILAYLLPHGIPFFYDYVDQGIARGVWDAQIAFGTREAEFIPCWNPNQPLKINEVGSDIIFACWKGENGVLAVVSNLGHHQKTVQLTGEIQGYDAVDAINGQPYPIVDAGIQICLEKGTFCMVHFKEGKN